MSTESTCNNGDRRRGDLAGGARGRVSERLGSGRAVPGVCGRLAQPDSGQGNAAGTQELSVHGHVHLAADRVLDRDDGRGGACWAADFLRGRRRHADAVVLRNSGVSTWRSLCRMPRFGRWRRSARTTRTICFRSRRSSRGRSSAASWAARSCRWACTFRRSRPAWRSPTCCAASICRRLPCLLAYLFFWSLGLSMVGILLATLTKRRFAHVFLSVAFVGGLAVAVSCTCDRRHVDPDDPDELFLSWARPSSGSAC